MTLFQRTRNVGDVVPHVRHAPGKESILLDRAGNFFILALNNSVKAEIHDVDVGKPADEGRKNNPNWDLHPAPYPDMANRTSAIEHDLAGFRRPSEKAIQSHI